MRQAFTLIELIIVIVLLGILAATALPRYVDFSADANQAKIDANIGALRSALTIAQSKARVSSGSTANLRGNAYNDVHFDSNYIINGANDGTSANASAPMSIAACKELLITLLDLPADSVVDTGDTANCQYGSGKAWCATWHASYNYRCLYYHLDAYISSGTQTRYEYLYADHDYVSDHTGFNVTSESGRTAYKAGEVVGATYTPSTVKFTIKDW